jgi:anti-sigma regulatory factor (Ser/Thr protein kinase)
MKKMIRVESDVSAAGHVPVDMGKLKQMLLNLVANAVKFTPEGGCVTVGARRLADAVEIAVSDTGIGIAKGDQDRLFEEFRQIDSTVGREQRGSGLGLALTKRLVELHGGQIRVASDVGKGSVFTLILPIIKRDIDAPGFLAISRSCRRHSCCLQILYDLDVEAQALGREHRIKSRSTPGRLIRARAEVVSNAVSVCVGVRIRYGLESTLADHDLGCRFRAQRSIAVFDEGVEGNEMPQAVMQHGESLQLRVTDLSSANPAVELPAHCQGLSSAA